MSLHKNFWHDVRLKQRHSQENSKQENYFYRPAGQYGRPKKLNQFCNKIEARMDGIILSDEIKDFEDRGHAIYSPKNII